MSVTQKMMHSTTITLYHTLQDPDIGMVRAIWFLKICSASGCYLLYLPMHLYNVTSHFSFMFESVKNQ